MGSSPTAGTKKKVPPTRLTWAVLCFCCDVWDLKPPGLGAKAPSSPTAGTRKETTFVYRTNVVSFQLNPPFRVGEIIFDDEIPCGDEIRLDVGWVDLISSAKQISSEQSEDFIALARFH